MLCYTNTTVCFYTQRAEARERNSRTQWICVATAPSRQQMSLNLQNRVSQLTLLLNYAPFTTLYH